MCIFRFCQENLFLILFLFLLIIDKNKNNYLCEWHSYAFNIIQYVSFKSIFKIYWYHQHRAEQNHQHKTFSRMKNGF